ncbi:MAG: energy-coupled thiamine transporter ThiT, partial [Eubacteriales bacterium]
MKWLTGIFESFKDIRMDVLWVVAALLAVSAILLVLIAKKKKQNWTAQQLAVGALSIAIAFVLSYIRVWHMPQGGSITLASMLPIMLFAYLYGVPKGLIVGLAYGALQMFQDLFAVHWLQVFLDYGVAFMALALAGVFRKKVSVGSLFAGMTLAGLVRFLAHTVSGAIFFAEYAPEGQNVWIYSAGYNSFVFVDLVICIVVALLPPVFGFIKR